MTQESRTLVVNLQQSYVDGFLMPVICGTGLEDDFTVVDPSEGVDALAD